MSPKKKSVRVEIPTELHTRARMKCAATNTTLTTVCREAISKWVNEEFPIILPRPENVTAQ